jgi:hypothetical protein
MKKKLESHNGLRKEVGKLGSFLDLLSPEMRKAGFVKPIPKSIFDRVSVIRALAENNVIRRSKKGNC